MTHATDFICRHGDSEPEAEKVYQWVLDHLNTTPERLVTAVAYELDAYHNAHITGIPCDQWAGVEAKKYDGSFSTFVQCDVVEDGLARTIQLFVEYDRSEARRRDHDSSS